MKFCFLMLILKPFGSLQGYFKNVSNTLENIAGQALRLKTISLFYNQTCFCWIFWALSSSWESSRSLFPNCWHLPALSFTPSSLSVIHNSDSRVTYYHLSFIPAHFRNDIFYVDIWICLPFTFLWTLRQPSLLFTWSSSSSVQLPWPPHTASSMMGRHPSARPMASPDKGQCWSEADLAVGRDQGSLFCLWARDWFGPAELYGYAAVLAAGAITLATGILRKEALPALPSQKGERGLGTAWPHLQAALTPQKHLRWFKEGCRMWVDAIQSCRPWGRWWTWEESFHFSTDFSLGLGQMEGGNALGKVTSLFDSDNQ